MFWPFVSVHPMPPVQISKAAWPHIQAILELELDDLRAIAGCLKTAQPCSDVEDLAAACATQIDREQVTSAVVESVLFLAINISRLERDLAEDTGDRDFSVAEAFAKGLEQSQFPDWTDEVRQKWLERVEIIAPAWGEESAIVTMSKARELLFDFQCVLRQSAVYTDVRHVFNASATAITGALVLHTLSLDYMEGDGWRQLHLTLSPEDVAELITKLQRAEKKAQVTAQLLEKSGVPQLTPKRNLS